MHKMTRAFVIVATAGLLGLTASAQQAPAPAKPAPDVATLLKQVLDGQRSLESKLNDIQKRLDSISKFLGDERASSFDTVDRRLRDIEDDIKSLKR